MRSPFAILAIAATVAGQNTASNNTLTSVLSSYSDLSNLTSLVSGIPGLTEALNHFTNVTVLAPSNAAFSKFSNISMANVTIANQALLSAVLSYHILNGTINSTQIGSNDTFASTHLTSDLLANVTGGQRVEALNSSGTISFLSGLLTNSTITQADITYNNGIIHIIDNVLKPPPSIIDTAEAFDLTALVGALTRANLVDTIKGIKDVTIFAPNNAAFQAISSVVSNASSEALASILKYHVSNGTVFCTPQLLNPQGILSFNDDYIYTEVVNGSLFIDQARIIVPNILISNGVLHIIDQVLKPVGERIVPGQMAFSNAQSSSVVPFTSGVPTPTTTVTVPAGVTASIVPSSSSAIAATRGPMATGAIGAGMLFAGAFMAL